MVLLSGRWSPQDAALKDELWAPLVNDEKDEMQNTGDVEERGGIKQGLSLYCVGERTDRD